MKIQDWNGNRMHEYSFLCVAMAREFNNKKKAQ
jgi:hypothetical protein